MCPPLPRCWIRQHRGTQGRARQPLKCAVFGCHEWEIYSCHQQPEGFRCPRCAETTTAWWSGRGLLICAACRRQVSVTAGTLFEKTRKPLRSWLHVAWEITNATQGVNALTLQHRLRLGSYQTAWSWLHKFRRAMVRPDRDRLASIMLLHGKGRDRERGWSRQHCGGGPCAVHPDHHPSRRPSRRRSAGFPNTSAPLRRFFAGFLGRRSQAEVVRTPAHRLYRSPILPAHAPMGPARDPRRLVEALVYLHYMNMSVRTGRVSDLVQLEQDLDWPRDSGVMIGENSWGHDPEKSHFRDKLRGSNKTSRVPTLSASWVTNRPRSEIAL